LLLHAHRWLDRPIVAEKDSKVCAETLHQILLLAESFLGVDEHFWIYRVPTSHGRRIPVRWLVCSLGLYEQPEIILP
jgi:hypothetical protein